MSLLALGIHCGGAVCAQADDRSFRVPGLTFETWEVEGSGENTALVVQVSDTAANRDTLSRTPSTPLRARVFRDKKEHLQGRDHLRNNPTSGAACWFYRSFTVKVERTGTRLVAHLESLPAGSYTVVYEFGDYEFRGAVQIQSDKVRSYFGRGLEFEVDEPPRVSDLIDPEDVQQAGPAEPVARLIQKILGFFAKRKPPPKPVAVEASPEKDTRLASLSEKLTSRVEVCIGFKELRGDLLGEVETCVGCEGDRLAAAKKDPSSDNAGLDSLELARGISSGSGD